MATVEFIGKGSGPSQCSNGNYENLSVEPWRSTDPGSGMVVNARVENNGAFKLGEFFSLSWTAGAQSSYSTILQLDDGSSTGLRIKIEARPGVDPISGNQIPLLKTNTYFGRGYYRYNEQGEAVEKYDPNLIPSLGSDYTPNQTISFDDGVISGSLLIQAVSKPELIITDVVNEGLDYLQGVKTLLKITSASMTAAGASVFQGNSWSITGVVGGLYTAVSTGDNDPAISVVRAGNEVIRMKTGIYKNLPLTGGSGQNCTVDITVTTPDTGHAGGGGIVTLGVEDNHVFGIPANGTLVIPPTPVAVTDGEGVGGYVLVGQSPVDPNSPDPANPDYFTGFYLKSREVHDAGYGYKLGGEVTISRQSMIDAGFELNVAHTDKLVSVTAVTSGSLVATVRNGGTGYADYDGVALSRQTLIDAGAIPDSSYYSVGFYLRTTNGYGTTPFIGGTGTGTGSGSVGGTYTGWATFNSRLDAINGIITERITSSRSNSSAPLAPDTSSSTRSSTKDENITIRIRASGYDESISGAGPLIQYEPLPVSLLYDNESTITDILNDYSFYISNFVRGDFYGSSITEGVRDEVMTDWTPNMPFYFYDPQNDSLQGMRMDATSWTVSQDGSVFTTSGIYQGESNGTVNIVSNLQGNAVGDSSEIPAAGDRLTGNKAGETTGLGQTTVAMKTITVSNNNYMDMGNYIQIVDVPITLQHSFTYSIRLPGSELRSFDTIAHKTLVIYITGMVVTAGDTLTPGPNGGLPVSYDNSILTVDATVVDEDLFATT